MSEEEVTETALAEGLRYTSRPWAGASSHFGRSGPALENSKDASVPCQGEERHSLWLHTADSDQGAKSNWCKSEIVKNVERSFNVFKICAVAAALCRLACSAWCILYRLHPAILSNNRPMMISDHFHSLMASSSFTSSVDACLLMCLHAVCSALHAPHMPATG